MFTGRKSGTIHHWRLQLAASTIRDDGHRQLTVAGHPQYTFVGDSAPGRTNGQGINLIGGVWTVVSPAGAALANPSSAVAATQDSISPG